MFECLETKAVLSVQVRRICIAAGLGSLLCVLLLWAVGDGPSGAAGMTAQDFRERSSWVFTARVVDAHCFASDDGRLILTRYRLAVDTTLKGRHQEWAEVVEYGGRLGDKELFVSHGARFRKGAEYLIFTHRDSQGRLRTLGGAEGQFQIWRDGRHHRMLRVYPHHPLSDWFQTVAPSGLVPLEQGMQLLSRQLERPHESR